MAQALRRVESSMAGLSVVLVVTSLILCLVSQVKSGSDKNCRDVKCQKPPANSNCKEMDRNDKSVTRPQGEKADCCPLWKCKSDKDSSDFFTFHGLDGKPNLAGTETVHYSQGTNVVRSVATGKHGATAIAGGGGNAKDAMKEVQDILKSAGLF